MVLSQDDVIQILKIMDASRFNELHLKWGDLELAVNKRGNHAHLESHDLPSQASTASLPKDKATLEAAGNQTAPSGLVQETEHQEIEQRLEKEITELGHTPIKAPMLGIFFRSPKPGAPPFVEDGSVVEENTTICIIEVMKLFSTIKAGVRGRIKRICADDGELVEFGQVLFLIDQDADTKESVGS
jgi:acetyl-CoA carboxylase biotin carboxyl carrier protein